MTFKLDQSLQLLERTPAILNNLLRGLPDEWIYNTEGAGTWSAFDVVGHLIVCEQTDFISRTELILSDSTNKIFAPLDMELQFEMNKGKKLPELLDEFAGLRKKNIQKIIALNLSTGDFEKTGVHPKVGEATLKELLATWVAHDLNHIAQITRIMATQYKTEVGPFIEFLSIIK